MTDSHAHLTIQPLFDYTLSHLKEFKESGGVHILNVSFDPFSLGETIKQSLEFENMFPELIQTSAGIHPEYLSEGKESLDKLIQLLQNHVKTHKDRINAIGECGLDYYHLNFLNHLGEMDKEILIDKQKQLFQKHVELAMQNKLPLTIHTRDKQGENICISDALKIVGSVGKGRIKGSFHSYTGDTKYLKDILDLGFMVGFNGIVTYPKAQNVRDLVYDTPLDRILLETDSPLLPPQKVRNGKSGTVKYATPVNVLEIAQTIAQIKGETKEKILEITTQNYKQLFLTN